MKNTGTGEEEEGQVLVFISVSYEILKQYGPHYCSCQNVFRSRPEYNNESWPSTRIEPKSLLKYNKQEDSDVHLYTEILQVNFLFLLESLCIKAPHRALYHL